MTQTTAYDIAGAFLKALGAPNTPEMRRAVTIWLTFESSKTVIGGNPWNLHVGSPCKSDSGYCPIDNSSMPGLIGNRYAGKGDQNVAVFSSVGYGATAAANNLLSQSTKYGYGNVIKAARSGNAVGFLTALQNSSWSAGHYGHSKLVNSYNTGGGKNYTVNLASPSKTPTSSNTNTGQTPNATQADFKLPNLNPLDAASGAITGLGTTIQETGVWIAFFFLGAMLIGAGVFLLAKGPAEKAAQTAGPIVAAAA